MSTLKVTVGEREHLQHRTRDRLKAAQAGEQLDEVQPVLNFESYAELSCLLSPTNLELLEVLSTHQPENIRETAEIVERDYKQVHQNLSELADIGVVEFEGGGQGRAKTPKPVYDGLEIALPFGDTNESVDAAPT